MDASERLDITKYRPYQHIYLKYQIDDEVQDLYHVYPSSASIFSDLQRIKIFKSMIEEPTERHGLNLKMTKLTHIDENTNLPVVLAIYPLHNRSDLDQLKSKIFSWEYCWPWVFPHAEMKG